MNIQKKLKIITYFILIVSMGIVYFTSDYMYKRYYIDDVTNLLISQTEKVIQHYQDGMSLNEIEEYIKWYNSISNTEFGMFMVPENEGIYALNEVKINFITEEDLQDLTDGQPITKFAFDQNLGYEVLVVYQLIMEDDEIKGLFYSYRNLTELHQYINKFHLYWMLVFTFFMFIIIYISSKLMENVIQPLEKMKQAALNVSVGNYDAIIESNSKDEFKTYTQAFNQMTYALQEQEKQQRNFLGDLSHELRTPLTYVKGYSHALLDGVITKKDEQKKHLELIIKETDQLQKLVGDVLDLTKLDSGAFDFELYPLSLAQCVEDVMTKYEYIFQNKNLELEMSLDFDVIINGNESRIEQIIRNLLENAIRYSDAGTQIKVDLERCNEYCTLMIADQGMGMTEEELLRVKERFYRVKQAETRCAGGSGIGLSIVEKLINMHGGEMSFASEQSVGTKVILRFPVVS
ncbi:MAG: sensor histidine kinase [Bacillus sp. (in: firmicutes)]